MFWLVELLDGILFKISISFFYILGFLWMLLYNYFIFYLEDSYVSMEYDNCLIVYSKI